MLLDLQLVSKTTNFLNLSRTQRYGSENALLWKRTGIGLFSQLPIEQHDLYVNIMRRICTSRQNFPLGRGHPFHYFKGSGVALRIDASTALVEMYYEILEDLRGKISMRDLTVKRFHFKPLHQFQYHLSADETNNTMANRASKYPSGLNLGYSASLVLHRRSEPASGPRNWLQDPGRISFRSA
jgi:hypothetical protein